MLRKYLYSLFILIVLIINIISCSSQYTRPYDEATEEYENKNYDNSLKKYREFLGYNIINNKEVFDTYLKIAEIYAKKNRPDLSYNYLNEAKNHIIAIEDKKIRNEYINKIEQLKKSILASIKESKKNKDISKVEKIYQTAINFYNKKDYLSTYKYLKLIEDSNYKETNKILDEIEEIVNKTLDNMFKEGFNLYTNGDYKEALNIFEKILSINPEHKEALYYKENSIKKIKVLESM
ncbi:MAG TPA: tetratricopeptide repeat protein [Spirochaetota bacterium]|nr:tetratricopeptide repeat protein [Spirochaetota bacterium]HOM38759.1 tetratricopeptide repeat protein [Spirochaetota bacterium]HPQ49557.1 tetratricopeptide repeat protein [Spirochaetota bacterium]